MEPEGHAVMVKGGPAITPVGLLELLDRRSTLFTHVTGDSIFSFEPE